MQFHRTQGNQRAMPISMILKTRSWVFRLLRSTLKFRKIGCRAAMMLNVQVE
jgi:hypothetical protein